MSKEPTAKRIVSVQFQSKYTSEYSGKEYNYYCDIPVRVGDIVKVPTSSGESKARVCYADVPANRIAKSILPLLKTITTLAESED